MDMEDLAKQFLFQLPNEDGMKYFSLYQERYEVETKFDDLKNELEAMPMRVQKIGIPVEANQVIKRAAV